MQLIECVPNISEGRNKIIIDKIVDVVDSVDGVKLLNVDPGKAKNRTVIIFILFGPSGRDHDSQNQLSIIQDTPNYFRYVNKNHESFLENNMLGNIKKTKI